MPKLGLVSFLVAGVAHAALDWNLESTFLMHLQQKADAEQLPIIEEQQYAAQHIYPTWVSEGTCSTKCVDIRGEEEFCIAPSTCEHATWRKAFDKLKAKEESLKDFEVPQSMSYCEVWGDQNRCDGTLCDDDYECQSGCCGAFVSFTHNRCLPILGDYCAGRDTTRKKTKQLEKDENTRLLALVQQNNSKTQQQESQLCKELGSRDLCDDQICLFDGECRSGCCTQVLTKGYHRCASMLVGDYCPRVLDPIREVLEAEIEKEKMMPSKQQQPVDQKNPEAALVVESTKLPCNTFGTVDRCNGNVCEHDVNCSSGCCSIFVSKDEADGEDAQKRCMPLVNGNMCPVSIDIVTPTDPVELDYEEYLDEDEAQYQRDHPVMMKGEHFIDDPDGAYERRIEGKKETKIVYEDVFYDNLHNEGVDDHFIPEKHEHEEEGLENILDEWRPKFHSAESPNYSQQYEESEIEEDLITNEYLDVSPEEPESRRLAPKVPDVDDPRIHIPTIESQDHVIVQKEIVPTVEHHEQYGKAYEASRKSQLKGNHSSAGLAPKLPEHEEDVILHRRPCNTYGKFNRCEGMTCRVDKHCQSSCCGQISPDGPMTCNALIENSICPRTVTRKVDYQSMEINDSRNRNNNLSNKMPTYRGDNGCKVHGMEDQCDGQPCGADNDCHSGCCGHFVSFSLMRCLPLTEDNLCPRILEPSFTSPIPEFLPPIQSTIKDMYDVQDRVRKVQQNLIGPDSLPMLIGILSCRSYGTDLCDGFVCKAGSDCQSGCCGAFGLLKQDYCQPQLEGICPESGAFKYKVQGNTHPDAPLTTEPATKLQSKQEGDAQSDLNQKQGGTSFWKGVIVGVVVWVAIIVAIIGLYCCCKKRNSVETESHQEADQYNNLAGSAQQH